MERLTVVVPCKNEAFNIERTIDSIEATIPSLDVEVDVLMIDDGSTDGTAEIMKKICAERPWCRMRVQEVNRGLGRTVLNSYHHIPEDHWVTVLPGDNELVFASIKNLLALRHENDLVLGYLQNPVIRTAVRRVASGLFSAVVRFVYGYPYRYLNGMKLYRAWIFKDLDVISTGHAFNAELLAKAILRKPDLRVAEAPFVARGRASGETKAFRPRAMAIALRDVFWGYRSVCAYREQVILESANEPSPRPRPRQSNPA
jgi:dolichol-phosphate mannosyltransferase